MTKVKKVLICHPSFWIDGGAEKVIVRLANWLTDRHIQVTILTQEIIPEIKQQFKEARIMTHENFQELIGVFNLICEDFDVINIHNTPCELMPYTRKLNTVWMCNEPPKCDGINCDVTEEEAETTKNHIRKFVVADEFNANRFEKIYGIKPKIIPYGIDYNFFEKGTNSMRDKYHLQNNFVVSQVAFIHQNKNQLRTLEIFRKIKIKIPNAKLVLAGQEMDYKLKVQKKIIEKGLSEDVIFTGKISNEEVRDLYHASNVVIQPCLSQGSWLSVFEAIAAGKPVIVSKEMTASSFMKENNVGFVAETDEEFVDFVVNINEDYKTDHEFVRDNLKWETFCSKMLEVFENE